MASSRLGGDGGVNGTCPWSCQSIVDQGLVPGYFISRVLVTAHHSLPLAAREVESRKDSFHQCNGRPIWDADLKIDVTSYSDASNTGCLGYCMNVAGNEVSGSWSETESRESYTGGSSGMSGWYSCQWQRTFQGKQYSTGLITSTWRISSRWEAHAQNCMPRLSPSTPSAGSTVFVLNQTGSPRIHSIRWSSSSIPVLL